MGKWKIRTKLENNMCPETATGVVLKKVDLKNFTIFIGKHLCWGLFLVKLFQHRCFPVNIARFLKTLILKNICERLLLNVSPAAMLAKPDEME